MSLAFVRDRGSNMNKFLEIRGIEIDKKIIRIYCKKNNENKWKKGYISLI